jgi:hypothetical protein
MRGGPAGVFPQRGHIGVTSGSGSRPKVAALLGFMVFIFSACAAPVAVTVPTSEDQPNTTRCEESSGLLPRAISGQERRETTPESPLTAAWGDPPVVWRCAVATPAALQPDSSLIEINGITWFAEELTAGYRFTTIDLTADVEVTVPSNYAPEAEVLLQLTPALLPLKPGDA